MKLLAISLLLLLLFVPFADAKVTKGEPTVSDELIDLPTPAGLSKEDSKEDFDPIATMMRALYISRAMLKGHEWVEYTEGEKQGYLIGYTDGMFNAATYYIPTEAKRIAAIRSLPTSQGELPIGQLVRDVDQFYAANAKNRSIPISFVLLAIRNRRAMSGEGRSPERDAKIQAYIASLQEMFRDAPAEGDDAP